MIRRTASYRSPDGRTVDFCSGVACISDWSGLYEPAGSHTSQSIPGRDGAIYTGSFIGEREVSITVGYVDTFDDAAIQNWRRNLQSVCNYKLNQLAGIHGTLYISENNIRRKLYAVPDDIQMLPIDRRNGANDAVVTFRCFDPYVYDMESVNVSTSAVVKTWTFPHKLGTGVTLGAAQTGGVTFDALGDLETPCVITIYGPCTNPIITSNTTGESIEVNTTLDSNDILVIDTNTNTVELNGVNAIQYINVNSEFFKIQPGENSLAFSEDVGTTTAQCFVEYSDCYIGL